MSNEVYTYNIWIQQDAFHKYYESQHKWYSISQILVPLTSCHIISFILAQDILSTRRNTKQKTHIM